MACRPDGQDRRGFPGPAARGAANLDARTPEVLFLPQPEDGADRGLRDRRQYRNLRPRRDDPEGQPEGAVGAAFRRQVLLGKRPAHREIRGDGGDGRGPYQRHVPQQAREPGRPHRPDRGAGTRNRAPRRRQARPRGRGRAGGQGRPAIGDGGRVPRVAGHDGRLLRQGGGPAGGRGDGLQGTLPAARALGRRPDRPGLRRRGTRRQDRHADRFLGD